jgi:WD40 repeat protein
MRCVHGYTRSVPRCLLTELHSRPSFTVQAWHLRAELRGHGEDVRAVAQAGKLGVATTSRDKTVRLWTVDDASTGGVTEATVFVGHTHFVGPLVWVPPGVLPVGAEEGALVTGSRDTTVIVWHPHAAVPLQRLAGHTQQVRAWRVSRDACRVVVAATGSPASTQLRVWALTATSLLSAYRCLLSASPPAATSSAATTAASCVSGVTAHAHR